MNLKSIFCGIFASAFIVATVALVSSCSQDDDEYNSDMYTLAEKMETRSGGDPNGGGTTSSFPSASEILANSTVRAKMEELWQATLDAASPNGRREFGCYIYYNDGVYSCVDAEPGPINTSCSKNSSIKFDKKDSKMCAVFHTHTTLEYCSSTKRRATGPSSGDEATSYASEMPCFVYDYLGGEIMGTQLKTASADVYTYGIERRK